MKEVFLVWACKPRIIGTGKKTQNVNNMYPEMPFFELLLLLPTLHAEWLQPVKTHIVYNIMMESCDK